MGIKEEIASVAVQAMLKSFVGKDLGDACMDITIKIDKGDIDAKIRTCKPS